MFLTVELKYKKPRFLETFLFPFRQLISEKCKNILIPITSVFENL